MVTFFLHGFGSNATDFEVVFSEAKPLNCAYFIEGFEFDLFSGQRRWFPFSSSSETLRRCLDKTSPMVEQAIKDILASQGLLPITPVKLAGHSQGGMLAMDILSRSTLTISEVDCYASFYPLPESTKPSYCACERTLKLFGSLKDKYVSQDLISKTASYFANIGVNVERYESCELSHSFSTDWLRSHNFVRTN
jgi:predicted esterase